MFIDRDRPLMKTAGAVLLVVLALVITAIALQFRGTFTPTVELTLLAARSGLVVEPGAKVTFHGVEVGRVAAIDSVADDGVAKARLTLDVQPRYAEVIPANAEVDIMASTVFGNKYIAFSSPEQPSAQSVSTDQALDVSSVTTEYNTLFETVTELAEQVDPVKLNQTLTATAEGVTGLGTRFGESITNGNAILDDLNPRMPQLRYDIQRLAELTETYAAASPELWDGLRDAVTTAHTVNAARGDLDAALAATLGFADDAAAAFERGGPYLVRTAVDLVPTTQLLDDYRGMIFCTFRNYADVAPEIAEILGGNGYSMSSSGGVIAGAANPYIYPDNLPRVNAKGGPGGRPGCWQKITHDLWPAPYLVMDTGASIAPYNHLELGQPMFVDHVWGRQLGEYTINP